MMEKHDYFCMGLILGMILGILPFLYQKWGNHIPEVPSAMDVYQGKTTLKTTYVDSIPVDSVVVFKKEVVCPKRK